MTEPAAGGICAFGAEVTPAPPPEPPQAAKKNVTASAAKDRRKNEWNKNIGTSPNFSKNQFCDRKIENTRKKTPREMIQVGVN
jgi:hypothetical protein